MTAVPEIITPHEGEPDFAPGMYDGVPNDIYHACSSMSKSGITKMLKSTANYVHYRATEREEKAHFTTGNAFHAAVLEPEVFEAEFVALALPAPEADGDTWHTKHMVTAYVLAHGGELEAAAEKLGYKASTCEKYTKVDGFDALLEHYKANPDLTPEDSPLDADGLSQVRAMRDAVLEHPGAHWLFRGGHMHVAVERSFWWVDPITGVPCRCRPDFMCWVPGTGWVVVDLKSDRFADYYGFRRSVAKWDYHVQDAFNRDGISEVLGQPVSKFVFVACDKDEPYGVGVYEIDPEGVERGRHAYGYALDQYRDFCTNPDGHWRGYGDGTQLVQVMDVPSWAS